MILPILQLGNATLRREAKRVKTFDESLQKLCEDMAETMYAAEGIGLAAPQIGVLKRVFVMDAKKETREKGEKAWQAFINPAIEKKSDAEQTTEEGCLSIPRYLHPINRPHGITLKYQNIHGELQRVALSSLEAACAQHELDHLNGKLFIDYIVNKQAALEKMLALGYREEILKRELLQS